MGSRPREKITVWRSNSSESRRHRVDNDVVPAANAGMVAVHVRRGPWGYLQARWPEVELAAIRLDSLAELPEALANV